MNMMLGEGAFQKISGTVALVTMAVAFPLFLGAGQFSLFLNITGFAVDMENFRLGFSRNVAGFSVYMAASLRQQANQLTGCIIAGIAVAVDHIVCLSADHSAVGIVAASAVGMDSQRFLRADKNRYRNRLQAFFRMFMGFLAAEGILFHGNGRKNQGIRGDKHHHTA